MLDLQHQLQRMCHTDISEGLGSHLYSRILLGKALSYRLELQLLSGKSTLHSIDLRYQTQLSSRNTQFYKGYIVLWILDQFHPSKRRCHQDSRQVQQLPMDNSTYRGKLQVECCRCPGNRNLEDMDCREFDHRCLDSTLEGISPLNLVGRRIPLDKFLLSHLDLHKVDPGKSLGCNGNHSGNERCMLFFQ